MRNLTLLTDLYELTMMQGYFKTGNNRTVIFDAFHRKNPCDGAYAVSCGLEQVIDYINNLHFEQDDINYLKSTGLFDDDFLEYLKNFHFTGDIYAIPEGTVIFPKEPIVKVIAPIIEAQLVLFDDDFLEYLKNFHFTGDIYAIPEGTVIFPKEPIVKVIAPIIEAQLVETAILNIINHQSLIATKAARICYAAKGDGIMEFGLRRAQGPDAGIYGARAAVIAGCIGTSNVLTGQMFDVPIKGTHAHSWIMSFPDEYTAFKTYSKFYPNACILLVDTYDTLRSGVPNAIRVFKEMRDAGIPLKNYGIRLDSGDLAYLSKMARKMLDEAGFEDAVISASSDLDEYLIDSLKTQGAAITSWGVGTNLITAKDNPAFGGVYKLAAIKDDNENFIPKIKLSENSEKITNPGNKTVYRVYDTDGMIKADLIALADEVYNETDALLIKLSENSEKITNPGNKTVYRVYDTDGMIKADLIALADEVYNETDALLLFDPVETWKKTLLRPGEYSLKEIMAPIFKDGKCIYKTPPVMDIQSYCKHELSTLWDESKRLINPHEVHVDLSKPLYDMKQKLLNPPVMDIQSYCKHELSTLWDESKRLINPHEVHVDLSKPLYDMKQKLLNDYSKKCENE